MEEENLDTVESTNDTEEAATEAEGTETESTEEVDAAKLAETNKKLYARLKKTEEELKQYKTAKPELKTPPAADVEEVVLKAQGMAPELLTQLKEVAALKKISLLDAQSDKVFVAIKNDFDKEQKSKAAALGSSRGSGSQKVQKTLMTPGLSREEHKKLLQG